MDKRRFARSQGQRTIAMLSVAVVAMFAFAFALVPLYDVFCDITGLNGKTNEQPIAATQVSGSADVSRTITVEFLASVNSGAPWQFQPSVRTMQVHPGEFYQTSYIAKNLTNLSLTGQAVPSVAPGEAAAYFEKIECFCFAQQLFGPGESKDMPVVFRIDPELAATVSTLTLSYTFFKLENSES